MITKNAPVKVKFCREKSLQCPKKEGEGGPGMVLALCHSLKRLKSLLSKRVVTATRHSHRNALNSLVAKSLRSSEGVWTQEEDLPREWRKWRTPNTEVGREELAAAAAHAMMSFIIVFLRVRMGEEK